MEFRPAGLGIMPPVVKNLLLINVIVYAATKLLGFEGRITELFALHHWSSPYFKVWQPLTHMFMHFDNTHIFSNMFALWMFGSVLENRFGSKRFLNFYLISGIGASILYLAVVTFQYGNAYFAQFPFEVLGASGAVFGILFGFGYLFPNTELYLYFIPIPIKAKYFVAAYALFELFAGMSPGIGDNVAHFAHLSGMLVAFIIIKIWNKTNRTDFY